MANTILVSISDIFMSNSKRPRGLQTSRSFSREPSANLKARPHRASTIQNGALPEPGSREQDMREKPRSQSATHTKSPNEDDDDDDEDAVESSNARAQVDELPIELVSLTDSFINSLSAKVHPTPPTVDKLSNLFQDFYVVAASHINTHIAALSSRQHRGNSPAPSTSSRSSLTSNLRAKAASISQKEQPRIAPLERRDSSQQMLTTSEIAERKKARKLLDQKRMLLEEAVERRVCESIYDRIWRHRSTQDEAQDEKLRSKTAALSVVGIGLNDLGIDLGDAANEGTTDEKEVEVRTWLEGARQQLLLMNVEKFPLGKLQHLKAAHKCIVDTLSHFHPSSSADEIMPMLIYTLITSPAEGINVISNLYFIQRFRNESKIDGEAAYCLTNLEAAITFLETVDLASLREDEALSGPLKSSSRPTTPSAPNSAVVTLAVTPAPGLTGPSLSPAVASPLSADFDSSSLPSPTGNSLRPSLSANNRRLSDLFQPPAQALGAASDAMLNTADQGLKTIGNSLGDSYKFLVGKLKERQDSINEGDPEVVVPRTLDDARRLVSTPPPEDDESASCASSVHSTENKGDDKVLSMIGGRRAERDRSVDSSKSNSSGKRVAFAGDGKEKTSSPLGNSSLTAANPAIAETMRNIGNTFNPVARFASMGPFAIKGFGRANPAPTLPSASTGTAAAITEHDPRSDGGVAELTTALPQLTPALPPKGEKITPPIKRFMEVQNPGDLKISEVLELLRDYRRLAGALKDLGAV